MHLPEQWLQKYSITSDCEIPSDPDFGAAFVSIDRAIVTYTCDIGYVMVGVVTRACQTGGRGWTDDPPVCSMWLQILNDDN